jgi:hypothetical protein
MTTTPWQVEDSKRGTLRLGGFSRDAIFDPAETVVVFNLPNRMASTTDMMPGRQYRGTGRW